MNAGDSVLKWVQRIWLFFCAPLMAIILSASLSWRGMEGGLLLLWTRPLFKLAAWPLGSVFTLFSGNYYKWATGDSRVVEFLVLMIEPVLGAIQWFILIPWLFRRWSLEARLWFWVVWFVSIPISLIVWLVVVERTQSLIEIFL